MMASRILQDRQLWEAVIFGVGTELGRREEGREGALLSHDKTWDHSMIESRAYCNDNRPHRKSYHGAGKEKLCGI